LPHLKLDVLQPLFIAFKFSQTAEMVACSTSSLGRIPAWNGELFAKGVSSGHGILSVPRGDRAAAAAADGQSNPDAQFQKRRKVPG
jgi:hypothetical protein